MNFISVVLSFILYIILILLFIFVGNIFFLGIWYELFLFLFEGNSFFKGNNKLRLNEFCGVCTMFVLFMTDWYGLLLLLVFFFLFSMILLWDLVIVNIYDLFMLWRFGSVYCGNLKWLAGLNCVSFIFMCLFYLRSFFLIFIRNIFFGRKGFLLNVSVCVKFVFLYVIMLLWRRRMFCLW